MKEGLDKKSSPSFYYDGFKIVKFKNAPRNSLIRYRNNWWMRSNRYDDSLQRYFDKNCFTLVSDNTLVIVINILKI